MGMGEGIAKPAMYQAHCRPNLRHGFLGCNHTFAVIFNVNFDGPQLEKLLNALGKQTGCRRL